VADTEAQRRGEGRAIDPEVRRGADSMWGGGGLSGGCSWRGQVVRKRLEEKRRLKPKEGTCGRCMGCKCLMPCRNGKTYGKKEPL
jgi:hypothetical protein